MSEKKKWVLDCLAPKCGTLADGFYNAGPMLADDRNGTTSEDSRMQVVSDVKEADFQEYVSELKGAGANGYLERNQGKDQFFAFAQHDKYYHVSYYAKRSELRVVEDIATTPVTEFGYSELGNQKTVFYQYGLYYDPQNDVTDKTVNCGMLYIIRLSDNSLFMVDGGFIFQCTDEMMAALWQFLLRITNTPENGTIHIAGWYFTHAHDDHIDGCTKLLNRHHDQIILERILFNFPYYGYTWGYSVSTYDMKTMVTKYYPQVKVLKLHTGQKFSLADMEIEVLYTQEDAAEKVDLGRIHLDDFNCTSSILKLTIDGKHVMMLGDTNEETERLLAKYSEPALWKADMVQVAHHCFNYLDTLYEWIAAPVAVMPNSYFGAHTPENIGKLAGVLKWLKDDEIYYEGQGTDGFVATENGFEHVENLPVIGGPYDGSGF